MEIKVTIKKPRRTILPAQVTCAPGSDANGSPQVLVLVSQIDNFDIIEAVANLRLSPKEARDLAARLNKAADEADPNALGSMEELSETYKVYCRAYDRYRRAFPEPASSSQESPEAQDWAEDRRRGRLAD